MNFGAVGHNPLTANCSRFTELFSEQSPAFHQPGQPDAFGVGEIAATCTTYRGLVSPIIAFQELNIRVQSSNAEYRTAFRWTMNGRRTLDFRPVSTPAVTMLLQGADGKITNAFSFYDDRSITGSIPGPGKPNPPPFNGEPLADQYIRLGATADGRTSPTQCAVWADLYSKNGTNNAPGTTPISGFTALESLCKARAQAWRIYVPAYQAIIPLMSFTFQKRLAIRWTAAGITANGEGKTIDAITVLFMDASGAIYDAWDFYDATEMPSIEVVAASV